MMDVQDYDDETKFFLHLKDDALKGKIQMTCLLSQGSIGHFVP